MTPDSAGRTPAEAFPPSDYIREFMEGRGWTEEEFASQLGWPKGAVRALLAGKRRISSETAQDLARAFGASASLWLGLEHQYQQWRLRSED